MEHQNFGEIRKLKSGLPQSLVDSIQNTGAEKVTVRSAYKHKQERIDSMSSSSKVVVSEPVKKVETPPKNNSLRQTFLDSQETKNENYVSIDVDEIPKKEIVKPRPLKQTEEQPTFLDYESEVIKEKFDEFYVKEKDKNRKYRFLYLFLFGFITYFILNFAYDFYIDSSNSRKLSHSSSDTEVVLDFLDKEELSVLREDEAFNVLLDQVVTNLNQGNINSKEVYSLVDYFVRDNQSEYQLVTKLDLNQTNALISMIVEDIIFDHNKVKTKRIIINPNMVTLSAVEDRSNNLVLNPNVLDLGIEEVRKSLHDLIINAIVDNEIAQEYPKYKISDYIDVEGNLRTALTNITIEDYSFINNFKTFTDTYRERLLSRLNSKIEEGITELELELDRENQEVIFSFKYFTRDIYSDVTSSGAHSLELNYMSSDLLSTEVSGTLAFGDRIEFKDHNGNELFESLFINSKALEDSLFNQSIVIESLSKDEMKFSLSDEFKATRFKVCLVQSKENICSNPMTLENSNFVFNSDSLAGSSLMFDQDVRYSFVIEYTLSGSDLKDLIKNHYQEATMVITSEAVSTMVTHIEESNEQSK